MANKQKHRGRHPEDDKLFGPNWLPILRQAVDDLCALASRGYTSKAALKLVGDHHQLDVRQRRAVLRATCPDAKLHQRTESHVAPDALKDRQVAIDGYNLLIIVESILSNGVLIRGRDGCVRDMASLHGSYHRVEETRHAFALIGQVFSQLAPAHVQWYFDAPVSNSGRLKTSLLEEARANAWPWDVELANGVDRVLAASERIVITSDSWILDRATQWSNVLDVILIQAKALDRVLDLGSPPLDSTPESP